jgi:hypothetical protein
MRDACSEGISNGARVQVSACTYVLLSSVDTCIAISLGMIHYIKPPSARWYSLIAANEYRSLTTS